MLNFTVTDWILTIGFTLLFLILNRAIGVLNKIHADLLNIESYMANSMPSDNA
jgi:hypothetical protein